MVHVEIWFLSTSATMISRIFLRAMEIYQWTSGFKLYNLANFIQYCFIFVLGHLRQIRGRSILFLFILYIEIEF